MKIRNGFVSNSSSTSFVVLLPAKFCITPQMIMDITEDYIKERVVKCGGAEKVATELKLVLTQLRQQKSLCPEDVDYERFSIFKELMKNYVLAEAETGADGYDQIILVDEKKVRKLLT